MTGADASIAQRLRALSASVVADALEGRGSVVGPGFTRYSGAGVAAGRAVTADCAPGSLAAVFRALDDAEPGDMLCIVGPGDSAYLGDLLALNLVERRMSGAIVDGMIRDVAAVAEMPLSIFARGVTPRALRGKEPGVSMSPLTLVGASIRPRDWIVADSDGVVVVHDEHVTTVLDKAEAIAAAEARVMRRIQDGASIAEAVRIETGWRAG